MDRVVIVFLAGLALLATPIVPSYAQVDTKDFKVVEIFEGKVVKTDFYSFEVVTPPRYLKYGWLRFRGVKEKHNLVMRGGSDGMDSYVMTVLYKGTVVRGSEATALAKKEHPDAMFVPVTANRYCVSMPLDAPLQLKPGHVLFLAYCVHPKTGEGYELATSYQSIDAYLFNDRKPPESAECKAAAQPTVKCGDPYDAMRAVMRSLVNTFAFNGVERE